MGHVEISIFDYDRIKLCDQYDSSLSVPGQVYNIVYVKEINGWKTLSFVLPYMVNGEKNFRWDHIKNENLVRYVEDDEVEWFIINVPKRNRDKNGASISITCDHISANLKTKSLYVEFNDENGIGTIEYLANQVLSGTGWSLGECDTFYENDGVTEKVRTLRSDGKVGAYQQLQNICDQFCGYPVFDGNNKEVHLYCLKRRNAQLELTIEKNASSIEQTSDSQNVITRLYVEGEYTEDGYVGIDSVNPTGLPFLLDFDYYKSIGLFKEKHQIAFDTYVTDLSEIRELIIDVSTEKNSIDSSINILWGQPNYVLFVLNDGNVSRTIYGGNAAPGDETFDSDDIVAIQHNDQTYSLTTVGENGISFTSTDQYIIKYITRAAGEIGAKEVAIEAKEKTIAKLEKEQLKEYIAESRREEIKDLIAAEEDGIKSIYEGTGEEVGLYDKVFAAVDLVLLSAEKQAEYSEAINRQEEIEFAFVIAMGDMLKDGYWCNTNYVIGQEENLYKDAINVMEDLAKPSIAYVVSVVLLSNLSGLLRERFDLNTSIRIYDEYLEINDFVYVNKMTHYVDTPEKDTIEIANDYLKTQKKTFESVLTRITELADILNVKKTLYGRADGINRDGSISALKLEGTIDILKAKLSSTVSNWYTDDNGNIIFVSVDGQSAMQLCGEGFMIANGHLEDGSWNWRTFGTGNGFTADAIVAGYLSADRIEAGSISAAKLDESIGASIDLSDNASIKMLAEKTEIYRGDVEPSNSGSVKVWIDTSGSTDVIKTWNGEMWEESVLSQDELVSIYQSLAESKAEVNVLNNEISQKVSTEKYVEDMAGKADSSWVNEQMSTLITQTDSKIEYQFDQSKTFIAETTQPLNEFKEQVLSYQRFTAEGLELGMVDSPFIAKQGNTKLSFLQDGTEVAYISNNKLHITEARVTDRLSIGTEENGYFDWITTSKGLALKWRG